MAASIQAAARELVTAPGTGPAIGGGEDSLSPPANLDARNATARKRPTESPPPVAPHKNARGPAKKKKKTNKPSEGDGGYLVETVVVCKHHDIARGVGLKGDNPVSLPEKDIEEDSETT